MHELRIDAHDAMPTTRPTRRTDVSTADARPIRDAVQARIDTLTSTAGRADANRTYDDDPQRQAEIALAAMLRAVAGALRANGPLRREAERVIRSAPIELSGLQADPAGTPGVGSA